MDRLEAFERMLKDVTEQSEREKEIMDKLKAEGKEKSATYKQFMGNRLMYKNIISLYKKYGLLK
ncbi:MAG: hypothetical protein ACI4KD_09230 [Oscillospiraceae bacterium]